MKEKKRENNTQKTPSAKLTSFSVGSMEGKTFSSFAQLPGQDGNGVGSCAMKTTRKVVKITSYKSQIFIMQTMRNGKTQMYNFPACAEIQINSGKGGFYFFNKVTNHKIGLDGKKTQNKTKPRNKTVKITHCLQNKTDSLRTNSHVIHQNQRNSFSGPQMLTVALTSNLTLVQEYMLAFRALPSNTNDNTLLHSIQNRRDLCFMVLASEVIQIIT